ncbi:MAG TPA: VOC family protein [Solirubrobacteraceae bacterium]|jgi:predicted enzyme related to lactoylglutathione lyase
MIRVNAVQVLVNDQDEARAFYTEKLGMEVRVDAAMPDGDGVRWLTVGPVGQPDVEIVLMAVPQPPFVAADTADDIRALMAKGVGTTVFLDTDDCVGTYEELSGRGVEYMQPPEERPYGWESGLRDPSGNYIRLTQKRA